MCFNFKKTIIFLCKNPCPAFTWENKEQCRWIKAPAWPLWAPPGNLNKAVAAHSAAFQELYFTSCLQGQRVARRTAEVKRLSASQQKHLMFHNNRGLVGGLQRCCEMASAARNCILLVFSLRDVYLCPIPFWQPDIEANALTPERTGVRQGFKKDEEEMF